MHTASKFSSAAPTMPKSESELKRKTRPLPQKPYTRTKPTRTPARDASATSAQSSQKHKPNLTLQDWLDVVDYYDQNYPNISQLQVVKHFASLSEGALFFSQGSLSRHLSSEGRKEDQEKAAATSNALSSKRARIVTRPDVEKALIFWVKHMERKREQVTGPMLAAKRTTFEVTLNVPVDERMSSNGWISKFCKA